MEQQNRPAPDNGPKMNMPRFNMNWIYFIAIMTLGMLYLTTSGDGVGASQAHTESTYTDFKGFVEHGYADKIVVNKNQNTLKMYVKAEHIRDVFGAGHQQTGTSPYVDVEIGSVDQVEQFLDKKREEGKFKGKLSYANKSGGSFIGDLFYSLLPLMIIFGLWMLLSGAWEAAWPVALAAVSSAWASRRLRCMRKVANWVSPSRMLPDRPVPSRRCRR